MVTVGEVLDTDVVRRGGPEVLAGAEGLSTEVRWVHVSDLPRVSDVIDGGELLLTTGGFLRRPVPEAVAELDELVDRGAVGVLLELVSDPAPLAGAVVERARERSFPLVVLHHRVRFVDITQHVHRSLVATQLDQVSFAADVHGTFTSLALQRADRAGVLDAAAALLDAPVVLEDQRRRVLGSARPAGRPGGSGADVLADWERRSRLVTWRAGTSRGGPERWLTTTVGVQGRVWARLVAPTAGSGGGERAAVVLERAAQALELGRMIERDDDATELRLHGGLLSDLLTGRLGDEAEAAARLRSTGLAPAGSYVGLVVTGPDDVRDRVRHEVRALRLDALVAPLDGERLGVLLVGDPDAAGRLGDAVADEATVVAAGPAVGRLVEVAGSLRSATTVAEVARSLPAGQRTGLVGHGDVRLHGLVAALGEHPALAQFVDLELGRVLEHDARHGTDLLGLLRAHLAAGGNVTELARATHRSRSSLYPALERLARVVGHPLDTAASRTSLAVALLAHDLGRR